MPSETQPQHLPSPTNAPETKAVWLACISLIAGFLGPVFRALILFPSPLASAISGLFLESAWPQSRL